MRDLTELRADLLDGPLAPAQDADDAQSSARVARVAQLAERGDHPAAAREAAELLEARILDVRVIGFYLFGLFLERGISYLPPLLGHVAELVSEHLAALRPSRRKLQIVNSATAWLFEHISARLQYHAKQRDALWESWRAVSDHALIDAIAAGATKTTLALEAAVDAPLATTPLARIRRWANDELRRPALDRRTNPVDRRSPEPPPPVPIDHRSPEPPPPVRESPEREAPARRVDDAMAFDSPPLAILQRKLRGFQDLVARGDLAKAAVVAADIRATLTSFDPVAFFPVMFAGYFKVLHQVIDQLAPYFDAADQPAWHALDSYYRADLHGFFDD